MANIKPFTVLESWSSISQKTVFVLDRSPYFTNVSSGHKIEGDCFKDCPKKISQLYENEPKIEAFDRSLWTCTIEAVVGYSRLVWDLFTPEQRCISILAVGPNDDPINKTAEPFLVEKVCTWNDEDQNLDQLLKSLAKRSHAHQLRPPNKLVKTDDISSFPNCQTDSNSLLNSLEEALSALSQRTNSQIERKKNSKGASSNSNDGDNNGRIILISSFQSEEVVNQTINKFNDMLARKNESLKQTIKDNSTAGSYLSPINYCDLVIVNTFPITDEGPCSKINISTAFKPTLHIKTYSVKSGRIIAGLLNNLCLQHHNLKSTTITGIPMKEEQNASSSSQYDVEIVHCSSIHEDIMNSGSPLLEGVTEIIDRNGFPCDTFKLGWCTPRTTAVELNHCVATSRITAVDVNSRPSACLTNFLLNGRQVMLEISKSKSNRMTTHILASHGGELYIHSLATSQHKHNFGDPPSIGDNLGGKVGNYRMNDFVSFMKQHTLTKSHIDDPLSRTCNLIKRQTLYWPIALGHTILLNVPNLVGELLRRIPKESMSQTDVTECKKAIDDLCKFEKDGQALPSVSIAEIIKTTGTKSGTNRLEQLYKLLWNELEYFLRVHSTTPEHESVLEYLLERHGDKRTDQDRGTKRAASKVAIPASPMKKVKVSSQLIPEINDANAATVQQTAMLYKTGASLFQTWSRLYHHYHLGKSKLTFIGRTHPPQVPQTSDQISRQDTRMPVE